MSYSEYISQTMGKGTIGATISMGIFALIAVFAVIGLYFGIRRGFTKSVIRFATILLSAFGSLFFVTTVCNIIINVTNKSGASSVDEVIDSYMPGVLDGFPAGARSILSQMNPETATIFIMMLVCIVIAPIIFISVFYSLKALTLPLYQLLCGLAGAIDYGKSLASIILGGVVGLIQGVVIAGIVLMPVSGMCGVLEIAKDPLIDSEDGANQQIVDLYDNIFNDLVDNPVFITINSFGGEAAYNQMVNIRIGGEKINMAEESKGILKVLSDAIPLIDPNFNWKNPTENQKQAMEKIVVDVGDNELLSSLLSDFMRGVSTCIDNEELNLPFDGTNKDLMDDVFSIFRTSTKDNIEEDLDMIVDIYLLLCEKDLLDAFNTADNEVMRELMTDKDENDKTVIDLIIDRLNQSERGKPIIRSFTKISLTLMSGGDEDSAKIYEEVTDDIHTVLSHNKADFDTPEEYREAVEKDLDKAFEENNLTVSEEVKQNMIDYIEENYSDTTDITEDDINDAILSYYQAYANAKQNESTEG